MSILSLRASAASAHLLADNEAEREASAIERMAELYGADPPTTQLDIRLTNPLVARPLRLSRPAIPGYGKHRSIEAHRRIGMASIANLINGRPANARNTNPKWHLATTPTPAHAPEGIALKKTIQLDIDSIRIDGGTQPRVSLSENVVTDYSERIEDLPAAIVFIDGANKWLADGFHRYHAAKKAGRKTLLCACRTGTKREAIWYSLAANKAHGLQRTNADKRKAVNTILADPDWRKMSDRTIADHIDVSHTHVANMREERAAALAARSNPKPEPQGGTLPENDRPSFDAKVRDVLIRFRRLAKISTMPGRWNDTIEQTLCEIDRMLQTAEDAILANSETDKSDATHH